MRMLVRVVLACAVSIAAAWWVRRAQFGAVEADVAAMMVPLLAGVAVVIAGRDRRETKWLLTAMVLLQRFAGGSS